MAILLTGGTGKTSTRLASLLQQAKIPFLLTSRKGSAGAPSNTQIPSSNFVKFDWTDSTTYPNPFSHSEEKITAIYLVAPAIAEPVPCMNAFIDYALKEHGVKRFVLLSGSSVTKGGRYIGPVWSHLEDELEVEFCILLVTWFMENFSEGQFVSSIKSEGKFYTAAADGKAPFVSAKDIAAVAFHALTDEKSHNTMYRVLGPELLTHDQIAEKLTQGLGRPIEHVKLTSEEVTKRYQGLGMPEHYSKVLGWLEAMTATGGEDRENSVVEKITGKKPMKFDDWIQENKTAWQ